MTALLVSHQGNVEIWRAAAAGNDARVCAIFRENLHRWMRGAPLMNEVKRAK